MNEDVSNTYIVKNKNDFFDESGDEIRINSVDYSGSIADGPGIRTVVFLQGCNFRCDGCHNPSTWDGNKGILLPVKELINELREKSFTKKITISGGEPLLQVPAVLKIVEALADFNIVLYTGYELSEVPESVLNHIDYIKVGKYIKKLKTTIQPYIGSKNQKFIEIRRNENGRR